MSQECRQIFEDPIASLTLRYLNRGLLWYNTKDITILSLSSRTYSVGLKSKMTFHWPPSDGNLNLFPSKFWYSLMSKKIKLSQPETECPFFCIRKVAFF